MIDIRGLAYVVAESRDPLRWKEFGVNVLGAMVADAPEGGIYLKLDERPFRIAVNRGSADCYTASRWEVADQAAFDSSVKELKRRRQTDFSVGFKM